MGREVEVMHYQFQNFKEAIRKYGLVDFEPRSDSETSVRVYWKKIRRDV